MSDSFLEGGLASCATLPPPARGSLALRTIIVSAFVFALASCGFTPLHGRSERAARTHQVESVDIVTDSSRLGQLLKAEIEDQVNPGVIRAEKPFVMTITSTETEISLFINPDGTSSRGDMQYNSSYTLTRKRDGKLIDRGDIRRVSSYNIADNADYATFVSREDARRRGVVELAQDYKLRLSNLVAKLNDPMAQPPAASSEIPAPIYRTQDTHEGRPTGF